MEEICRLCCSNKFVNNNIFDEENALYLKMSLYLPIKVFKNDRLPQKVCDRCSCKVNDFYQFCNETIEVQNRLRVLLLSTAVEVEDSVDLTLIKHYQSSPPPHVVNKTEPNETTHIPPMETHNQHHIPTSSNNDQVTDTFRPLEWSKTCDRTTQTEDLLPPVVPSASEVKTNVPLYQNVKVKDEPKPIEPQIESQDVKMEDDDANDDSVYPSLPSDNSEDDMSLIQFKKKKSKKAKVSNGNLEKKKRKKELKEWELLMRSLPAPPALGVLDPTRPDLKVDVKQELDELTPKLVKQEPVEYHCCVCFVQCYSRGEMLQHYREHAAVLEQTPPPPAPPPPAPHDPKCSRCQKRVDVSSWAAHWLKHWERDRRPYRCALCEKTFRDHHQILKHGLTHKWGDEGSEQAAEPEKRFVCDLCPEGFVYMRYLLAHRARAHPEAAARALALRCALCARQFAHLNSLRRHLRAHTGERNFLCNICGKALSSREHLKFHIRIHTGYKPNVCKTCGKGFVKKCNLTLHERVHSGERPHVCPHCGKAFSQRSTLVIHERYHSGARPYQCPLCHRGFVAKGLLSMHLKTTCI